MRRSTALLGTSLVTGALLLSGCGSEVVGTVSPELAPASAVRSALNATTSAGTARVSLTSATTMGATHVTIAAAGLLALDGSRADITVTLPGSMLGAGDASVTVHEKVVDKVVYLRLAGVSLLPDTWVKVGPGPALGKAGLGNLATGSNMTSLLEALRDLGDVTEVGQESVDGTEATHYRATIDPARIAAAVAGMPRGADAGTVLGTTPIPVEIWVDAQGRLVRATVALSLTTGGTTMAEQVRLDIRDFGVPLVVTAPASSLDLGGLLGGLLGPG